MTRIYVIEDDKQKSLQIKLFLSSIMSDATVEEFSSFNSGLKGVETVPPDVLILDMTLPTFDRKQGRREGRMRPLGGYDLLRKLRLRRLLVPTIVVTQLENFGEDSDAMTFDQITTQCAKEFGDNFVGSVRFQLASGRWKVELQDMLGTIVR